MRRPPRSLPASPMRSALSRGVREISISSPWRLHASKAGDVEGVRMARRIRITFDKIRVHKSEDYEGVLWGLAGEAGDSAEWTVMLKARIHGQLSGQIDWDLDDIVDGSRHVIDKDVDVELNG